VQEQAELVGLGRVAGGAVGLEMVLPCLDVVFGLTAGAIEPLVEVLGAAGFEVGDNKPGIGSLASGYWTLILGPKFSAKERKRLNLSRFYAIAQV
jgi:hypothetical protein